MFESELTKCIAGFFLVCLFSWLWEKDRKSSQESKG